MLTTKEEIKKELLDNIEQLKDNPHAEDLEGGIISLMQIDLLFYYLKLANEAWEEIKTELEEKESN